MGISAFLTVFNEEKRIKLSLISLQWCDEIILLDKNSADKTKDIAIRYNAKVFIKEEDPNIYNSDEFEYMLKYCTSDWIILFTASDVISYKLAMEIKRITSDTNFSFDIIKVPFKRYIMGLEDKRSPWYSDYSPCVFRKSVVNINGKRVHDALQFQSNRIFTIDYLEECYMYHLTHETVDSMMDRHTRYWHGEAKYSEDEAIKNSFYSILRAIRNVLLRKKTFLLGWKGVMLGCAYISYYMMSFVYKWENKYSTAVKTYTDIRKQVHDDWVNYKK
jgi:glycosyltransferase involved in cell wall biosynthesis